MYGQTEAVLAPEEVLFRLQSAPERIEEDDLYSADRHLRPGQLPESDLLKVLHTFTADYYDQNTQDRGQSDAKSLDASALLALGILLEESAAAVLGMTGDMAFVEGQAESSVSNDGTPKLESGDSIKKSSSLGADRKQIKRQKR